MRFLVSLVTLATSLFTTVLANNGPSSLYSLLNGQTFNPPGYTIVMYQSCVQNQNAGNPCGSFSGYQSSNGQYTRQLYGPEASVGNGCSRTFYLTLACGATISMGSVSENPTCVYSATLSLPQVCGVDMTVGNEAASTSPSIVPVSSSMSVSPSPVSASPTNNISASTTPTALYQIIYTPFPSTTSTTTLTATSTPLFMVTAWPTSSPLNVSATSTPLYMYTAYPSVPSNSSDSNILGVLGITPGSSTATILGAVAVGVVGLGAIGYAIHYLRNGGTLKGLLAKAEAQKGALTNMANMLPLDNAQKSKMLTAINNPKDLLPPEAQKAIQIAENANQYKEQALNALPLSDEQKAQIAASIHSLQQRVANTPLMSVMPSTESVEAVKAVETVATVATEISPASAVSIAIHPNDIAAVQEFLAKRE